MQKPEKFKFWFKLLILINRDLVIKNACQALDFIKTELTRLIHKRTNDGVVDVVAY